MFKKINCLLLCIKIISIYSLDPPYGQLKIQGVHVTDLNGIPVQLRGMSLFWSQWMDQFWSEETLLHIRNEWNSNLVRAPMGIMYGGYLENPEAEYDKVKTVVEAAIKLGIYVIVDWHEERADEHIPQAIQFFTNISQTYGSYPHIIYEIWNEPNGPTWPTIKTYAEQVIPAIRANDPNNIIVVGTPTWSEDVDIAASDPLNFTNVAYTLHYYAASNKQFNRNKATTAINQGICLFITEYGTVLGWANGTVDENESNLWWEFSDQHQLSYANWAIDNKNESAAALIPGTTPAQVGDTTKWTASGKFVNQKLQSTNQGVNPFPTTTPFPANTCPTGWYNSKTNPNKCLKFSPYTQVFKDANDQCFDLVSGSLVSIDSGFENAELTQEANQEIGICDKIFIGLTRNGSMWNWQNGDTNTYQNWDSGYPDANANNNCAYIELNTGRWRNSNCNEIHCYICQKMIKGPVQ